MRALTLHQPWAALVAVGIKLIENRPVRPPEMLVGERFAIHAGMTFDEDASDYVANTFPDVQHQAAWWALRRERGKLLATAQLLGVVRQVGVTLGNVVGHPSAADVANRPDQFRWFTGPIGYVLADVRPLREPVACRGMQGFWPVPTEIEQQVLAREVRS